jgi:hypothetical protein
LTRSLALSSDPDDWLPGTPDTAATHRDSRWKRLPLAGLISQKQALGE